jgi:hypothetical protein
LDVNFFEVIVCFWQEAFGNEESRSEAVLAIENAYLDDELAGPDGDECC